MISTKNIISDIGDIPIEWVFEYYLNLSEKLTGQDVKMLSVFSGRDKVPSMFVYYKVNDNVYKYKDFSSGYQGDHIDLVQKLFNLQNRHCAVMKILEDYHEFLKYNTKYEKTGQFKVPGKYRIADYLIRHWTKLDAKYWTQFEISSKDLDKYNVAPLEYYLLQRTNLNGSIDKIKITGRSLYGYFKNDGTLYKVYQPKNAKKKFIKCIDYIQGSEQLTYDCKYLIITSSLKDLMTFNKLGIGNIESIAPDSENTMLPKYTIESYKSKYSKIFVLFDNDEAGKRSTQKYVERYGITGINLELEKDLADAVKTHGSDKIREIVLTLLKEKL
jgi:hypothetical protein